MTITYRDTKGSALTYGEVDENFRDLRHDTTLERVLVNGNSAVNSSMTVGQFRLASPVTPPTSNSSSGVKGQITYDSSYIYVCVANNSWRRASLVAW